MRLPHGDHHPAQAVSLSLKHRPSLGSFCLFPQTPGAHSVRLAHAAGTAPVRSHRSAAASLSPPNDAMTGSAGCFLFSLSRRHSLRSFGLRAVGAPVRSHRSAAASLSPPNAYSTAALGASRYHLSRVIPALSRDDAVGVFRFPPSRTTHSRCHRRGACRRRACRVFRTPAGNEGCGDPGRRRSFPAPRFRSRGP